jgi:GNAT superfamily N-acetyltransferase
MTFPERHTLNDGTRVLLRYIQPSDRDELRRGFRELSAESRYRRFFAAVTDLDDRMLDYLTKVDGENHVAIVAFVESLDMKEEHGVGVARFIRVKGEPNVAEIAITVVDDQQRKGLGTLLLLTALREARARGITHFRGECLQDNAPILSLLEAAGARARPSGEGTVVFDLAIDRDAMEDGVLRPLLKIAARHVSAFLHKLVPASE